MADNILDTAYNKSITINLPAKNVGMLPKKVNIINN